MGGICYLCKSKMGLLEGVNRKMCYSTDRVPPENMMEDDKMCSK